MSEADLKKEREILPDISNIKTSESYVLPSKGLVYEESENIPASITLRRMTTKEDKIRMRNSTEDVIRKEILNACITTEGVDAGKLKLVDANFLLFRLRSLSLLDDTYKVACRCPHCGTQFVHQINLMEVPINYFNSEDVEKLEITLPISKHVISLKYPSLNEMISRGAKLREYFTRFPDADRGEALYTMSGMLYVGKVNGTKMISEELEKYLDDMDILDSRVLRTAISDLEGCYGFDENLKTECPSCKNEVVHGLPITGELFNPSK